MKDEKQILEALATLKQVASSVFSKNVEIPEIAKKIEGILDRYSTSGFAHYSTSADDKAFYCEVDIPGLSQENVEVVVTDHSITLRGRRESKTSEERSSLLDNRFHGLFEQHIAIPFPVKNDQVKATIGKGVLSLSIPRDKGMKVEVEDLEDVDSSDN